MGFWFGRKSVPEVRQFVPAWLQVDSEVNGLVRGYEAQFDEVYRRNPVGLRAVRLVAGLVGSLPLFAEDGDSDAVELIRAGALMEQAAASLLLHGNAYVRLAVDGNDRPAELHYVRPERVSIACGADGWPSAYLYRAGGQVTRIQRDDALGRRQIAHLKALNPGDDHYDPDRDYQTGQMRASTGTGGARDDRIELPAVLTATEAKQLAEAALARRWQSAATLRLRLPPSRMEMRPGDAIQLAGISHNWTVRSVLIDGMAVDIEADATPITVLPLPADSGRPVTEPDLPVGRSELMLFELPAEGDALAAAPRAYVAACSTGLWKSLPVELILGSSLLQAIALGKRAVLGRTETALDARCPMVVDDLSTVIVRLVNEAQLLLNADQDAMMAGANVALVGDELIQFGRAEQLGGGIYRLSKLLRGRRGTEWAAATHDIGEGFCLVDPGKIRPVDLNGGAIGAMFGATAHGIGDVAPLPMAKRLISGEATRPPSPCQISISRSGSDFSASWVRRSHRHWAWVDGVGDGADSFPELYRVAVHGPNGQAEFETASRSTILNSSEIPGQAGQSVTLSIVTVGPAALSHPATVSFIL